MTIPELRELLGMSTAHGATADATIIRQVLAGDVNAFASIVDRYHARCLRVATHLLGDVDEAEDAVQEAFVRAYRHLGSFRPSTVRGNDPSDGFGAWVMRIVVNQCRTRAARMARFTRFDTEPSGRAAEVSEALSTASDHEAAERRADLAQALALLGAEQREAVVLRFADELTYDEMASITGVGVSALKMRVQRACTRLRALLAEHLHA